MSCPPIVVLGASAGGVEALRAVVGSLLPDLPATVFAVLHTPPYGPGALPLILQRSGPLPAAFAEQGWKIEPGRIVVAPHDRHLLIRPQHVELTRGPKENGYRPAIDVTLRSAARWHGSRVIGVILSGTLDDGAAGVLAVRRAGGYVVVQDPEDALYDGMPRSALAQVRADHVLPAIKIGPLLARLAEKIVDEQPADANPGDRGALEAKPGSKPSPFSCPLCHGVLWETSEAAMLRFNCRIGHGWSIESLIAHQGESTEAALWTAVRVLEERAALCERIRHRADEAGHRKTASHFEDRGDEAARAAELIRGLIVHGETGTANEPPGAAKS